MILYGKTEGMRPPEIPKYGISNPKMDLTEIG